MIKLSARFANIWLTKQLNDVVEFLERIVITIDLHDERARAHPNVLIQFTLLFTQKLQLIVIVDHPRAAKRPCIQWDHQ